MNSSRSVDKLSRDRKVRREGKVLVTMAIMLVPLIGFASLAMDLAHLRAMKKELQNTADAAALAGVTQISTKSGVITAAQLYAGKNMPSATHGDVLLPDDIFVGRWDFETRTFTPNETPWNAVRVVTRRAEANDNPAPLWLAVIFGQSQSDVAAEAVAVSSGEGNVGSRFMLDDEMWDTDVPDIEDLAEEMGVDPIDLLTDNDGDWFIDMPPGEILELPTGEVGDEGIFDIDHPDFPFGPNTDPSFTDFLNYNEDSNSWRYDLIPKEMLDPLYGVTPVNDPSVYPSFVDPDFVHVSPVHKSDINELNPVGGTPVVNALGWRRSLVAYKIIGVGEDPDGPGGSVLPSLIIQIVDPALINVSSVQPYRFADAAVRLVW